MPNTTSVQLSSEFIVPTRTRFLKPRFRISGPVVHRRSRNSAVEICKLPAPSFSAGSCPSRISQATNWLVYTPGVNNDLVFLNYEQKLAMFSSGEVNSRLPAPVIKLRSSFNHENFLQNVRVMLLTRFRISK
jgi:hypothetical protein